MVNAMKSSNDPMLGIFQNRKDKDAVAAYLAEFDAASRDRKTKAEYSRSGKAKTTVKKSNKTKKKQNQSKTTRSPNI